MSEPFGVRDNHIELVAMKNKELLVIRCDVNRTVDNVDIAEIQASVIAQEFVMITGQINQSCALADLAQQLLHHIILGLRPVPTRRKAGRVSEVVEI